MDAIENVVYKLFTYIENYLKNKLDINNIKLKSTFRMSAVKKQILYKIKVQKYVS